MNSNNIPITTACPLDCYDTCKIDYIDGKLKGSKDHPITRGYLCCFMDKYKKYPRLEYASYKGNQISLKEALDILIAKIKEFKNACNLYYQGSGNLGLMQSVPALFFDKVGFECARGSMCDGEGDVGIVEGRGANLVLPYSEIEKSDVVILWGRNPLHSNKHILPFLKNKKLIVIDPLKTQLAKKATLHLQIKPRGDIYLAMMLARLAIIEQIDDRDFCQNHCENFDDFIDLIESYPLVGLEKLCEISLLDATKFLEIIKGKKVSILVGIGVQKYPEGADVLRFIDGFAATLGLFGKEGCGVSYLADSSYGFEKPFKPSKKSNIYKANVDFSKLGIVFISNANPLTQMPNRNRVHSQFAQAGFRVYFGLHKNETSQNCDLVIPAASFLEKKDIKPSYSHEYVYLQPKIEKNSNVLSEYELTEKMFALMGLDGLRSEDEYLEIFKQSIVKKDTEYINHIYQKRPYSDGFYTQSKKFIFIDEYDDEPEVSGDFFLINSRQIRSLNSQFDTDETLYVPVSLGFADGDIIVLSDGQKERDFEVKNLEGLRDDCLLINSGAKGANFFTRSTLSYKAHMALYHNIKVNIIQG